MTQNQKAFLDMIALSEIGKNLLDGSDNGYNVIVGSTAENPILFDDYSDHPRRLINLGNGLKSTSAGRYQLLARYYDAYKAQLGLSDFSPDSQDAIALQQIKERHALDDIDAGNFDVAVEKVSNIWASLPGAGYGQHENKLADLRAAYVEAGGIII
ncbi:MAG: glycoside hydrolase family 104 protein [Pseudomonadota bacterium]